MGKRYASVAEMVRDLSGDQEFTRSFERSVAKKRLSRALFVLRMKAEMTQTEVAEKLGWTQSRVSKLESADIDRIRTVDVAEYARALGL